MTATRRGSDPTIRPSASDPPAISEPMAEGNGIVCEDKSRPGVSRNAQTQRPKANTRASILPARIARNATNTSALNEAIWNNSHDGHDSDSSSSSSSDEEESPAAKQRGRGKAQRAKTQKGAYSKFNVGNEDFKTRGRVSKRDGRLNISVRIISSLLLLAMFCLTYSKLLHLAPITPIPHSCISFYSYFQSSDWTFHISNKG